MYWYFSINKIKLIWFICYHHYKVNFYFVCKYYLIPIIVKIKCFATADKMFINPKCSMSNLKALVEVVEQPRARMSGSKTFYDY